MARKLPISEKTQNGMTWSPDDHKFLKLCFDREEQILTRIEDGISRINTRLDSIEVRIDGLEKRMTEITKTIDCTKSEVEEVKADVLKLNKINDSGAIKRRIWKGVWIGVAIMTVVYVPLTIFAIWYLYKNYWSIIH